MEINDATQPCAWFCVVGEIFLSVIRVFCLFVFFYSDKGLGRISSEEFAYRVN